MRVRLSHEETSRCMRFARESCGHTYSMEWWDNKLTRTEVEHISDIFLGKVGELALQKVFGGEVDFNIYKNKEKGDDGDVIVADTKIDVKASKSGSNWLIIPAKQVEQQRQRGALPDVYYYCTVDWDRDKNTPVMPVGVSLFGWVEFSDLTEELIFCKGEKIPHTNIKLQTDNYLIHRDELINEGLSV